MEFFTIASRKNKFKRAYLAMRAVEDEYSCGVNLAGAISPRIAELKKKCNEHIRWLKKNDPDAAKLKEIE